MKLRKFLAGLGVMLLTTAGVLVLAEAPASANGPCPSGYVCFYENVGYTGSEYDIWAGGGNRFTCQSFGFGFWWDRASSVRNRTGTDVTLYSNAYCGGSSIWMYNGMGIGDLGAWGANDSIDAVWIN